MRVHESHNKDDKSVTENWLRREKILKNPQLNSLCFYPSEVFAIVMKL
jgi:hypothetical protein